MKDRVNHDADWEEAAWAKLLNSNQDILVLMGRLFERKLITQEMITMATLPDKPPPPREQDMRGMSASADAQGQYPPGTRYAASTHNEGSMMGNSNMYGGNSSMMGGARAARCKRVSLPTNLPMCLHTCCDGGGACRKWQDTGRVRLQRLLGTHTQSCLEAQAMQSSMAQQPSQSE
jgi:hypothetical protein